MNKLKTEEIKKSLIYCCFYIEKMNAEQFL